MLSNRDRRLRLHLVAIAVAALVTWVIALGSPRAQERLTLNGSWTASPLGESWSFTDWGEACGPKPAPRGAGGGSVQIREQGGELSIVGAGRAFSTAECWEQMPGVSRTSHSASGNGRFWRTRCSSAANDPRRATIVTTISATDTSISLNETGQYEFRIEGSVCSASVVRSRSFSIVKREGEAPPPATASASASAAPVAPPPATTSVKEPPPPPEPKAPPKCAGGAGEPARLEVKPSRRLLKAGEDFTFRAFVLDAEGCPTGTRPSWSVKPGPLADKVTVDAQGTVKVLAGAPEGSVEISAAVAGKGVTVTVEIASPERYDALLAARSKSADEAVVAVIATGTIGGVAGVAEDTAKERKRTFVAVVVGIAAVLGLVGLVFVRRGRRADREPIEDPPPSEGEPVDAATPERAQAAPEPAPAPKPKEASARGKICPTCGERYGADASFCGKDRTTLVLIN